MTNDNRWLGSTTPGLYQALFISYADDQYYCRKEKVVVDEANHPILSELYRNFIDGRIVERVQQTDVLAQMRQLYGRGVGMVGLGPMFWCLKTSEA